MAAVLDIHLLCMENKHLEAFNHALTKYFLHTQSSLPPPFKLHTHTVSLSQLSATRGGNNISFDLMVSPANSFGRLDGGFDDAISRALSPKKDYFAVTRKAQEVLRKEWRGYAPPGTCTLMEVDEDWSNEEIHGEHKSPNVWSCKWIALCPTMRTPMDVKWDREVVYECIWSLLCAVDKHNRGVDAVGEKGAQGEAGTHSGKITSMLMSPMATGCGMVSPKRWAEQTVLAIKHWIEMGEVKQEGDGISWMEIRKISKDVAETWRKRDGDTGTYTLD